MKQIIGAAALALATITFSTSALAQEAPPGLLVTIDENGHGTVSIAGAAAVPLVYALLPDTGPGGLSSVLTYVYPFTYVPGDVLLLDADENNAFLHVLRFNPGTIAFYSDNLGGADALADTASPPGAFYTNLVRIPEVGPEGDNGAF